MRIRAFLATLAVTTGFGAIGATGIGALGALGLGGCGSNEAGEHGVTYQITAKSNYEKGLKELKDENFPEAIKYFNFVKQKFPFSKFAVLAELRLADTQ